MIKRILVVVGILVVAGLIAWRLSNNKEKMKENAALTAEKIAVYSVEVDTAHTITFNGDFEGLGSFEPAKEMNFLSEVAGKVLTLSFKEGDRVREGQTVATLDNEAMQNDLTGANTALTKAQNDVAKLDAVVRGGGATGQQLIDARFGIEQAQNKIAGLNIYLRKSEVKAPMSGIVFKKLIDRKDLVFNRKQCFVLQICGQWFAVFPAAFQNHRIYGIEGQFLGVSLLAEFVGLL